MKYYSLEPILSRGASLMITIGKRGSGKTFAFKEYAYNMFMTKGAQWMYVRRGEDELNNIKAGFWDDLILEKKLNKDIKTKGHICYIRESAPAEMDEKEKSTFNKENPWQVFGYFVPLSKAQNFKSASFPLVDKICYDEIIIENPNRRYLKNEVDQFTGLVSTVFRNRKGKAFCMSNAGYVHNPFFTKFNVNSKDFENTSWVKRDRGKVIFEYNTSTENDEELMNTVAAQIGGESYVNYAVHNKFKDDTDDMISDKPRNCEPMIRITTDGKKWITFYHQNGVMWGTFKNTSAPAFSLNKWSIVESAKHSPSMNKLLLNKLNNRKMRFSSPEVREQFIEWMRRE